MLMRSPLILTLENRSDWRPFYLFVWSDPEGERVENSFVFYLSQDIASYKSTLFFLWVALPQPLTHGLHMKSGKHYWNNFEGKMVFWALVGREGGGGCPIFFLAANMYI